MIDLVMQKMASGVFLGNGGTLHRALIFMLRLGWKSRFRLPVILVIVFVAMDYGFQLQIEFDDAELQNRL